VGSHIGETEKKTEELLEQTHGGVLFVDEAYRLNVKDSDKDFGKEAINTLMKAMTVKGKVIVLAGYPREMAEFVAVNPGIQRRITYEFVFDDYTVEDLGQILRLQVQKRGFSVDPSVDLEGLTSVIGNGTTPQQRVSPQHPHCKAEHRGRQFAHNEIWVPGEIWDPCEIWVPCIVPLALTSLTKEGAKTAVAGCIGSIAATAAACPHAAVAIAVAAFIGQRVSYKTASSLEGS